MSRTTDILNDQINLYGTQSEGWRAEHGQAMACLDLEEVVAFGNFIFERIRHIDAQWSAEMERAGAEPFEADAKAVEALYAEWRDRAKPNLDRVAEFERAGHGVKGSDRLRESYREVELMLSVSVDRLRRSAEHVKEGRTRPLAEVRDELLRRFGPRG